MSTWRAFPKLTLSLRVLGVRDDGYHELDTLTVSVSEPHDKLTIDLAGDDVALELTGNATAGVTDGPDNLASRAARALFATGVRLRLQKDIPAGAGLGGGSADAAAVLVALNHLLELGRSTGDLMAIAATLGSDIPFCVRGDAARMRGRGERLEPAAVPELHVLVAVPPFALATTAVYAAWDELGGPTSTREVQGPLGLGPLTNDLEPAAERVEPRLAGFRAALERAAGAPAILAGSGSACAVLYDNEADAIEARGRVVAGEIASICSVGITRSTGVEQL